MSSTNADREFEEGPTVPHRCDGFFEGRLETLRNPSDELVRIWHFDADNELVSPNTAERLTRSK